MKYTRFKDIPKFTQRCNYRINVSWDYLREHLADWKKSGLDLDPDFQRAHVWTREQKIAYVEYALRGGMSGQEIYFNCPQWSMGHRAAGQFVLVDGKQRLQAVLDFLEGRIPAFGSLFPEYTDKLRMLDAGFIFNVNELATRAQVLRWYLEMNTGGTPHTEAEIDKVKKMLETKK
jgi:hypothetical protein